MLKKRSKVPDSEQLNAKDTRTKYFEEKAKLKNNKEMKAYTIEYAQDEQNDKVETPNRDMFEYELQMDLIGKAIKLARQERNLTQEELGKLIGVQKLKFHDLKATQVT